MNARLNTPPKAPDVIPDNSIPDNSAELREAVIGLAASMNYADWQFIKLVRAMDHNRAWRHDGFCSLPGWLDYHCGLGSLATRERIRVGRALEQLPRIDKAFCEGVITYSKVRAVTRIASPETDELLLGLAQSSSANELERLVRTYERTGGATPKDEPSTHAARSLDWRYEDGMVIITAALPAEQGAMVVQALQQVVDGKQLEQEAYWRERYEQMLKRPSDEDGASDSSPTAEECCSVETVADTASATAEEDVSAETDVPVTVTSPECSEDCDQADQGEDPATVDANDPDGIDECLAGFEFQRSTPRQRQADALVDLAEHSLATPAIDLRKRRPGRRYEVVLHISRDELAAKQEQDAPPRYYVEPGGGVDEAAARQIGCDADVTELIEDDRGRLLDIKSRSRIVPPAMRRKLELRDGGCCQFPGCHHTRYLEAHHILHWINGGKTELDNLMLLCSAHHRLHHEGQFNIHAESGKFTFVTRHGEVIPATRNPQFPIVSAETLPPASHLIARPTPTRPNARSPLRRQPTAKVAGLIRFREQWARGKVDRLLQKF